ncbi:MAG: sulfide/dihydroorotate dehydrogenase-like FAD/NAD-binding protein [Planctomycetota bacterium]|nr:sulfide/dihydroorotate dehydrogenase-like FAD/NAD-binding protein [Planctomycetota bacterium]
MYKVVERKMIVPNLHELVVEAPHVASSVQPGNFIILRADENGERIPLSVADWDREAGTVSSIFMQVGGSTAKLAQLHPGDEIPTFAGPLGRETEIEKYGTVVCVMGCYGIGSMWPVARALKEAGNEIVAVIEARSTFLLYWLDRYKELCDKVLYCTRDGTLGRKGHAGEIPDMLRSQGVKPDLVMAHGCTFQMKRMADVTREPGWKTVVNMNPIMIDGTGMCGVCRLTVGGETKFACVDGPDFDAHEIDWDEFLARRKTYFVEETEPLRHSGCGEHAEEHQGVSSG